MTLLNESDLCDPHIMKGISVYVEENIIIREPTIIACHL